MMIVSDSLSSKGSCGDSPGEEVQGVSVQAFTVVLEAWKA